MNIKKDSIFGRSYTYDLYSMKDQIQLAIILLAFPVIFSTNTPSKNAYCKLESCRNESHVMCKFPNPGPADACKEVRDRTFNFDDRQAALEANNYRLQWDIELAIIAQRWADQCSDSHDKCRNVARFKVRQRAGYLPLGQDPTNRPEVYPMLKRWNNEDAEDLKNENRIGCGKIKYYGPDINNKLMYLITIVCNYGNYVIKK